MRTFQILTTNKKWLFIKGNSLKNEKGYAIVKKDGIEVFSIKLSDILNFRC